MNTMQLDKERSKARNHTNEINHNPYQHSTLHVLFGGNRFYILATFILFLLLDGTALIAITGNQ